jgi:vacuolar protein sorting-associated protein 41
MECLAELYIANRQPGQALPYFLRLRRPNVFQLIQDNNLYTDVQGQVLLLVEFDQGLIDVRRKAGETEGKLGENKVDRGQAINLLVNYTQSIPVRSLQVLYPQTLMVVQMSRVVQQLEPRPYYLYLYLDALFERDRHLGYQYADRQVWSYLVNGGRSCSLPISARTVRRVCTNEVGGLPEG